MQERRWAGNLARMNLKEYLSGFHITITVVRSDPVLDGGTRKLLGECVKEKHKIAKKMGKAYVQQWTCKG